MNLDATIIGGWGGKRSIPYVLQSKLPQIEQIFFMDGSVEISLRISMKIVKI